MMPRILSLCLNMIRAAITPDVIIKKTDLSERNRITGILRDRTRDPREIKSHIKTARMKKARPTDNLMVR